VTAVEVLLDAGGNVTPPRDYYVGTPPLECGFCWAPRWNDESVTWLPLYGPDRVPYCANTCAPYVGSRTPIKRNGGLEVWAALHDKDEDWFA
jgi:hypothetical protein